MIHRRLVPIVMASLLIPVAVRAQGTFTQVDLLSDVAGDASRTNAGVVNPWGLVSTPNGGFWVANNGTATSMAIGADGSVLGTFTVPTAAGLGPTGIVLNEDENAFLIEKDGVSGAARFIVSGLDGSLSGWNPNVDADEFIQASRDEGEVYTGLAIARVGTTPYLYVANFAGGEIEVYDTDFEDVELAGDFEDPNLPDGYAPFNVQEIDGHLFVAYAVVGDGGEEEAGAGLGIVSEFDTEGNFLRRFVSNGELNAPWAIVEAPGGFARFGGSILIGNFGDGTIHAYDRRTGELLGAITDASGDPIEIEGLWGLSFASGHGKTAGGRSGGFDDPVKGNQRNWLYFAAGIDDEEHGLFGYLAVQHGAAGKGKDAQASLPNGKNKLAVPTHSPARMSAGAVSFRIEAPATDAIVLRIYDSSGRLVATPANGVTGMSEIRWDGKLANGARAQSGIYFYSVQSGGRASGGRLVLLP